MKEESRKLLPTDPQCSSASEVQETVRQVKNATKYIREISQLQEGVQQLVSCQVIIMYQMVSMMIICITFIPHTSVGRSGLGNSRVRCSS